MIKKAEEKIADIISGNDVETAAGIIKTIMQYISDYSEVSVDQAIDYIQDNDND